MCADHLISVYEYNDNTYINNIQHIVRISISLFSYNVHHDINPYKNRNEIKYNFFSLLITDNAIEI